MKKSEFIERVVDFMKEHVTNTVLLEELAAYCSYSGHTREEYVNDVCKRMNEYPPSDGWGKYLVITDVNDKTSVYPDFNKLEHIMTEACVRDITTHISDLDDDLRRIQIYYDDPYPDPYEMSPAEKCFIWLFHEDEDQSLCADLLERYSYGPDSEGDIGDFCKIITGYRNID
jgi:hypothetical protein